LSTFSLDLALLPESSLHLLLAPLFLFRANRASVFDIEEEARGILFIFFMAFTRIVVL